MFDLLPIDWTAIGAIGTLAAVLVAIFLPLYRERPKIRVKIHFLTPYEQYEEYMHTPETDPKNLLGDPRFKKSLAVEAYNLGRIPVKITGVYLSEKKASHRVTGLIEEESWHELMPEGFYPKQFAPYWQTPDEIGHAYVVDLMNRVYHADMRPVKNAKRAHKKWLKRNPDWQPTEQDNGNNTPDSG